jgi:Mrp family chromosome partitioning ATPase
VQEEFIHLQVPQGQGLSTYLAGLSADSDLIISSGVPQLDLIVSGPVPPNPSELLLSQKMTQLMTRLEHDYDYVVLDTAPLGLVSDSLDLLHLTDVVLYIVRQGYSPRQTLEALHAISDQRAIKNLFLVLNDVTWPVPATDTLRNTAKDITKTILSKRGLTSGDNLILNATSYTKRILLGSGVHAQQVRKKAARQARGAAD